MTEFRSGTALLMLEQGDITAEDTDAIVNAANSSLAGGGGVDGAIHRAGGPRILRECRDIRQKTGECPPGKAVITSGGDLKARFVIHTVGPVWRGGGKGEERTLRSAYRNSLELALSSGNIRSIAFPSISTGAYGYPVEKAAIAAIEEVVFFIRSGLAAERLKLVKFVLYDPATFSAYDKSLDVLSCKK